MMEPVVLILHLIIHLSSDATFASSPLPVITIFEVDPTSQYNFHLLRLAQHLEYPRL
ncbi:hypothetical protein ANAPC5_00362 [Anaplasma phagocytophilum]|nr:hypothetical protein ANAPC2_00111 [Anaplasma phagocytophilum]SBO31122.1 hypothetical protein ANAPC4_00395 [Anaplasma phagocytophilum]SBO31958.1 hypothetical protein ANAPC3_00698 [Anaplasma phagocytophilum]SCV62796.1 hypothetical protein ANAPC5_00362 [Anaplasma phagocytophilum]